MSHGHALTAGIVVLLLSGFLGCARQSAKAPPPTQKVEGVVLRKDGKPVAGGGVEFRHATKPEFVSLGEVGADGRFTLRTMGGVSDAAGAQEGEHTVTYTPASAKQEEMIPVTLSKKYMIKAGDNNITVTLED
jgi:hypothetical protein